MKNKPPSYQPLQPPLEEEHVSTCHVSQHFTKLGHDLPIRGMVLFPDASRIQDGARLMLCGPESSKRVRCRNSNVDYRGPHKRGAESSRSSIQHGPDNGPPNTKIHSPYLMCIIESSHLKASIGKDEVWRLSSSPRYRNGWRGARRRSLTALRKIRFPRKSLPTAF